MRLLSQITILLPLLFISIAEAAPVFYTSESSFLSDINTNGITLDTDNFENLGRLDRSNTYDGTSGLNITSNTTMRYRTNNRICSGRTDCLAFSTPRNGSSQTFSFDDGPINAFGLLLSDLGTVGLTILELVTSDGASEEYSFNRLRSRNEMYFGISDFANDFTSVTITNSRRGDYVSIDNVSWGSGSLGGSNITAVPEPGFVALLGLGFLSFSLSRKKIQQA